MDLQALTNQYNNAVADVQRAVDAVRNASPSADNRHLEANLRNATAEAQRCRENLDRAEELAGARRTTPAPTVSTVSAGDAARFRTFGHGESIAEALRSHDDLDPDFRNLSLGRAMRAMGTGNWHGAEAEARALGTGTGSAGGFLVPDMLSATFFDRARAAMVTSKAGGRTLMLDQQEFGTYTFAKLLTDPAISWTAEAGSITPSDPTFGAVTMDAKKATCIIKVSRELLADAPNADQILERTLASAFAAEIDRVILEGSGAGNEPAGILATVGIGSESMGNNGAAPTNDTGPAKLAATVLHVRQANHEPSAAISSPRQWSLFHTLKDGQKQPLRFGAGLDEMPWYQTSNCSDTLTQGTSNAAGNVYVGDFSKSILAVRQGIEIYVTRDPYLTTDEIAFLCTARVDHQVEDPGAFAALVGITA